MQPDMSGECYIVGKMWSYRSEASEDLDRIYDMLYDIPRCGTKKEIISLIRRSISALDTMKSKISAAGTGYLLEDYNGDDCPDTIPGRGY